MDSRSALTVLALCLVGCHSSPYAPFEAERASLSVQGGLALVEARAGEPLADGEALGQGLRAQIHTVYRGAQDRIGGAGERAQALAAHVPPRYLRELQGMSQGCGVPLEAMVAANTLADSLCTAVAAWGARTGGPLLLARNMDFKPADLLGPYTLLRHHPAVDGRQAFVSVGWPGFNGVASGMNAAGVCAVILLNHGQNAPVEGTPLAYRVRALLEGATSFAQAKEILTAAPVASDHYVLLADPEQAAVVYQASDAEGSRFVTLSALDEGLVVASNGESDRAARLICDERARCLADLTADGALDDRRLRRVLGAAYLKGVNCQSMLFRPGTLRLQVAVGRPGGSAAIEDWVELDLGRCLGGEGAAAITVRSLETPEAYPHFTEQAYPGHAISAQVGSEQP